MRFQGKNRFKKVAWLIVAVYLILLQMPYTITYAATTVSVSGLTCEYLTDPLGIDVTSPRLSWKLTDSNNTRGQRQTAYQILLASSLSNLNSDIGDLWNSGTVGSSQSALVAYNGTTLTSGQDCYWKVRVWDKDNQASNWSTNARFSIGLLNPADWKGSWIYGSGFNNAIDHVWFRKTFTLSNPVNSALAYVCSTGYHELYVNGVKVSDRVLAPARSQLNTRALYVTYDITSYLTTGNNVVAIWSASGWARWSGVTSAFKCQVNINTTGGLVEIHSDTSWKCHLSSSKYYGNWSFGEFGGEVIDARNDIPNWNTVGYNDSAWSSATVYSSSLTCSAQMLEPDRKVETINPVSITGSGTYVVDMGKNYTGWFKINLHSGSAGQTVTLKMADKTGEAVTCNQQYQYIFDSSGSGTFCNRFNYFGGRYVTISGLNYQPALSDITGYAVTNDLNPAGSFSCSKTLFNQIYNVDLETYRACTLNGVTVDCPHRERMGYGEVGSCTSWGIGLTSYDAGAYYTNYIRSWSDNQSGNGYIPHTSPQNSGGGGTMWSSCPLIMSWELYRTYGDTRILSNYYSLIKKWLGYLHSYVADGVLQNYEGTGYQFLGDWATPHGNEWGDSEEAKLFNNCVYAYVLDLGVNIANVLGNTGDAATFAARLSALRTGIHNTWYNVSNQNYLDNRQIHLAFPLYAKVVPEELKYGVYAQFVNEMLAKNYLDTGSSGLPVLLRYLIEDADRGDLMYNCVNSTTYPSYGYFINLGETTWPEYWSSGCDSRIHTCYTGIVSWFIKGIGGIRPDPASYGFKDFLIKPAIVGDLTWANTDYRSLYGDIQDHWTRSGNTVTMNITIPVNSAAKVYIPAANSSDVTESGVLASNAVGVQYLNMDGGCAVFRVQSGVYSFQTISLPTPTPTPPPPTPPTPTSSPTPTPTPIGWTNVALASNGGTAIASSTHDSSYPVSGAINGNRTISDWENGGGWNDATSGVWPDWIEVDFNNSYNISEIDVITHGSATPPTLQTTCGIYGITAFDAQYWNGSAWLTVPGGSITGNNKCWRQIQFAPVSTNKIRLVVNNGNGYSRVVELEAWKSSGSTPTPSPTPTPTATPTATPESGINVALASNGGTVSASSTYSSSYPASGTINGDRKGLNWANGGGWNDATANSYPDWLEANFNGDRTIGEIDLFTCQDNYSNPTEPTPSMTFSQWGITAFNIQYWNGSAWVTAPNGSVTGNNNVWRKFTFTPVTTNKIRVVINNSIQNYSRITEIEAWTSTGGTPVPTATPTLTPTPTPTPTQGVNLALNKTVTSSSSYESDGWFMTKAVDGQRSSVTGAMGWTSNDNRGSNHTEWVTVDLGAGNSIGRVDLYPRNDSNNVGYGFPIDFTIELSTDNTNWTTVVTRTNYPLPGNSVQSFTFGSQNARYVKITGTSIRSNPNDANQYRMQFAEIEVYEF